MNVGGVAGHTKTLPEALVVAGFIPQSPLGCGEGRS